MENEKQLLGKRIQEIRKSKHLTQPELAEIIAVDPKYISRLETGTSTPSLDTLYKIANALNVEIAELFSVAHLKNSDFLISEIISNLKITNAKNVKLIYNITNNIVNSY